MCLNDRAAERWRTMRTSSGSARSAHAAALILMRCTTQHKKSRCAGCSIHALFIGCRCCAAGRCRAALLRCHACPPHTQPQSPPTPADLEPVPPGRPGRAVPAPQPRAAPVSALQWGSCSCSAAVAAPHCCSIGDAVGLHILVLLHLSCCTSNLSSCHSTSCSCHSTSCSCSNACTDFFALPSNLQRPQAAEHHDDRQEGAGGSKVSFHCSQKHAAV